MAWTMQNFEVDTTAGAGQPTLERLVGGGIALLLPVQVGVRRRHSSSENQAQDQTVELQLLPSQVRLFDQTAGRTVSSDVQGLSVADANQAGLIAVLEQSREQVHALEALRGGRALEIKMSAKLAVRTGSNATTVPTELTFRVAASDWIEMLGQLGIFRAVHVVLPLSERTDASTNDHIKNELNRASRLFREGDYSGCVAVIRDVWDPIVKELEPAGRWDAILDRSLPNELAGLLKSYAKELRSLVNKGHHRGIVTNGAPALYEFTAYDAELVLSSALSFLRYLGNLAR